MVSIPAARSAAVLHSPDGTHRHPSPATPPPAAGAYPHALHLDSMVPASTITFTIPVTAVIPAAAVIPTHPCRHSHHCRHSDSESQNLRSCLFLEPRTSNLEPSTLSLCPPSHPRPSVGSPARSAGNPSRWMRNSCAAMAVGAATPSSIAFPFCWPAAPLERTASIRDIFQTFPMIFH